jgi:hypothetical protein
MQPVTEMRFAQQGFDATSSDAIRDSDPALTLVRGLFGSDEKDVWAKSGITNPFGASALE